MNNTPATYRPTAEREANLIKPKRPLSAYNLFYRYKRQKILEALASGGSAVDKDIICRLVTTAPGLEHHHPTDADASPDIDMLGALRRKNIRRDMENNTDARDTRARLHRKDKSSLNGAMNFVELGKLMNTSWKECDEFAKSVFRELAEDGREKYQQRMKEYQARKRVMDYAKAITTKPKKKKSSKKKTSSTKTNYESIKTNDEAAIVSPNIPRRNSMKRMNETAEILVHLHDLPKSSPFSKMPKLPNLEAEPNDDSRHDTPSLLDLLSKRDDPMHIGDEAKLKARDDGGLRTLSTAFSSSAEEIRSADHHPLHSAEEMLAMRVREIEGQLAKERLRFRIRKLQEEMYNTRNPRHALFRSVLDDAIPQNRASAITSAASYRPQMGLWGHRSPNMDRMQVSNHHVPLKKRHVEMPSKRALDNMYCGESPKNGFEGLPNKKQRSLYDDITK